MKDLQTMVDKTKVYTLDEAIALVKETSTVKFDASVEIHARLGINPKKGDQQIRATVVLPHGTGKTTRIAAFVGANDEQAAKDAGADLVLGEEEIKDIKTTGKADFDVAVATPEMMPKLGKLGKILGPKGLMPNPKSGTVTKDVIKAVKEIKAGRVELRVDKYGIIHVAIGKSSLEVDHLTDNLKTVISVLMREKPTSVKGAYLKKITVSSTMGPGVKVDKSPLI